MDPYFLATYGIVMTGVAIVIAGLAFLFYIQRNDAREAINTYRYMIEETRQGRPPFLLNPGVSIVKSSTTFDKDA